MGLDMYARWRATKPAKPVDFLGDNPEPDEIGTTFHTWRKHPNLHGWMFELYDSKGGEADDPRYLGGFNAGNQVEITLEDLAALEKAIGDDAFYEPGKVSGFFFGESLVGEDRPLDREFIAKARDIIAHGRHVYYTSWW